MPQAPALSERQSQVLDMIREYIDEYDYPPSIREIGDKVGISSTSVVSYNLKVLEKKGYLLRDREVSRGLRLVDQHPDEKTAEHNQVSDPIPNIVSVPLLGVIAAGEPIDVPGDLGESSEAISLSADMLSTTDDIYGLQVHGTSMIDDLINDGDLVILKHQTTANNGDTVAAWLKDEKATTLKRIYFEPGKKTVRLQPANPLMEPIIVPADDVEIQGKLICVIRRLG